MRALFLSLDPKVQTALPPMLAALGVTATIADNRQAAIAIANADAPDLIFIDSGSPPIDVAELAKGIAPLNGAASPKMLIVLIDGNSTSRRDEYLLSGATDCLNKPVTFAALKRAIDTARRGRPETQVASLDAAVLEQLRSLETHSAGLVQRVVSAYVQASTELLARLRRNLSRADAQEVFEAAHALKSSSMNVGANRLAEIARALESSARAGDTDYTDTLVGRMEEEHRRVCTALGEYSPRRSA